MSKKQSNRREFLQLADTYKPDKHKIAGFYMSEKLDGKRCLWDGGCTRGMPTDEVPWANKHDPKTGERKAKIKQSSTGLWTRYGNPIIAPDWWLDQLPPIPIDGELWAGRGKFQLTCSICSGDEPDPRFDQITYCAYSSPSWLALLQTGEIKNANMLENYNSEELLRWLRTNTEIEGIDPQSRFEDELEFLREHILDGKIITVHRQHRLCHEEDLARAALHAFVEHTLDNGGEGVVLRDPNAHWKPKRHRGVLKYKPYEDAEARIIGYRAGKEGRIGQALGKIGTLLVETVSLEKNTVFEIGSGLTLEQRELTKDWRDRAKEIPGDILPGVCEAVHFKIGDLITFKYRELTDDGIPKEARFWRKRPAE